MDDAEVQRAPQRIFLIGLMGSGKTSVGRKLSGLLSCRYFDNDTLLFTTAGATAEALSRDIGAEALHEREAAQLRDLIAVVPPFVATIAASVGDRPAELARLAASGHVVYLRATPETLCERLGAGAGRPWLQDDPVAVIRRMFAQRDGTYTGCATLTIDCDELDESSVVDRILTAIGTQSAM